MDAKTFETLGLSSLIELLARHAQTPMGRNRAYSLSPTSKGAEIEHSLALTTESVERFREGERFGLSGIEDPEAAITQLQVEGTSLDPHQILGLERVISVGQDLREAFKSAEARERWPILAGIMARIPDLRRLLGNVHGKILPTGEIDDSASPELRLIRREFGDRRGQIHRRLETILRNQPRAVQDDIVTFRNDRFVIPVRTDSRGLVPGVVHGLSSSGQTTFLEPLVVIEENNELVRLREREGAEIARILLSITEDLRTNLGPICITRDAIAEADFAQAKARLSIEFDCVAPEISTAHELLLQDARHILLERTMRESGGSSVPISLALDETQPVLLVSGPNAGGKTVILKTVGLMALMAQMGLHVPARSARLPVFDQIFADIGDQQSIAANLSTFTAHMRNIAEMAVRVKPPALVLLDEVGTGTDPDEGAALGIAIVDYFRGTGAATIATTHFPGLKMWAGRTEGVRNASVEFDELTLRPTYRLILGIAGASSGLEIARRMQLPQSVLDAAQNLIEPSHAQARDYLKQLKAALDEKEAERQALHQEREKTAEKHAELDLAFARREAQRREDFDAALAGVVREFSEESQRAIKNLKDRAEAARLRKTAERVGAQLRTSAENLRRNAGRTGLLASQAAAPGSQDSRLPMSPAEIGAGARVVIRALHQVGVVESIQGDVYSIRTGALKFRARLDEISVLNTGPIPDSFTAGVRPRPETQTDLDRQFDLELKVIGMTADEATARVDKFLDEAFLAGAGAVRIIHGHGKGILRKAIAELLKGHPQVDAFRLAAPDQGGAGATMVDLKK
jgi:DNA mismatch repair protein MutS2